MSCSVLACQGHIDTAEKVEGSDVDFVLFTGDGFKIEWRSSALGSLLTFEFVEDEERDDV